jgi:hypothetical protein
MQMIDVLKRLAELDAKNTNVVKEGQVQECGPMGMMDSMPGIMAEKPSIPANFSINASAASGNEVADMMSQILTLAGLHKVGGDDLGAEPQGAVVTAEPVTAVGPMAAEPITTSADSMRSVLDKLNPEPVGDEGGEELGPFQHDSDNPEGDEEEETDEGLMGAALGGVAGGVLTKTPAGAMTGAEIGSDIQDALSGDKEEETDEGQYDNSPADTEPAEPFSANQFAHQENQPGSGETSNGEKRQSNLPTATYENLMKAYKQFIGESAEEEKTDEATNEEELDEGTCSACHKDPCVCDDEKVDESTLDILKLAGLK